MNYEEFLEQETNKKYVCKNCGREINSSNYPQHGDNLCFGGTGNAHGKKINASTFVKRFV